jgi:alpha-galactosidase
MKKTTSYAKQNRQWRLGLLWLFILTAGFFIGQPQSFAQSNLAPTPPMGWANWNHYFCDYDDATIRSQADAMVRTGMKDLGYKYLIIQECIAPARDSSGVIVPDGKRFPNGIKPLVDYIHSRSLKAGIYTDIGAHTCFDHPQYEGSFDHEDQDAATFASWDIDLIEVDYCNRPKGHTGRELYGRMAAAIRKTGRPMLLYICSWGNERPWEWAQGTAQLWRTDADVSWEKNHVQWTRVVQNFESNARHAVFSAPNSWNDPDMLEVGVPGLTPLEARSHFSMWAISAAPLWAGADLTNMDAETLATYTNPEVIAVDQDPLGAGPVKAREEVDGLQAWDKQLGSVAGGNHAVLLLNLTSAPAIVGVHWSDLALLPGAKVRDLWARKDLGSFQDGYSKEIPAHGSLLLKVSGETNWRKGAVYEAEWPGNTRQGAVQLLECGECSASFGMAIGGSASEEEASGALVFPHLNTPRAGRATLQLFFLRNGLEDKNVTVQINDAEPVPLKILTFVWNSVDVPVDLKAGDNTVTVRYTGKSSFYLDRIKIIPQ